MKSAPAQAHSGPASKGSSVFNATGAGPAAAYRAALDGLRYEYAPHAVVCRVCLGPGFASHAGRIHGGLIATLFDEVMGHAAFRSSGAPMVTTLLRVRFVEPMLPEVEHRMDVRVGVVTGGVLDVTAELLGPGVTVAAASAKFRRLVRSQFTAQPGNHGEEEA